MMQLRGSKLLVVDDEPVNTSLLATIFRRQGCDVMVLNRSTVVLDTITSYEPDLIILDVMMPELSGYDLTKQIKTHDGMRHIPVVLLTALGDQQSRVLGLESGAEDYVTKPFNRRELLARCTNLLKLKQFNDFLKQNLRLLQEYDNLTGLPNKKLLREVTEAIFLKTEGNQVSFAICETELNRSAIHNLAQGQYEFEESQLHRGIVERIVNTLPKSALIGCLGEGKFGIALEATRDEALLLLKELRDSLRKPFIFNDQELYLPVSIGLVTQADHQQRWKVLLNHAELALAEAKRAPGSVIREFLPEMDSVNYERWWMSQALYAAIQNEQFQLYYQPQVDLQTNRLTGFEALMRWPHLERGFISPSQFIPLAESNGAIHDLSLWVFEEACKQAKIWQTMGFDIVIGINLSAVQLYRKNLAADLIALLAKHEVSAASFELELTETSLADQKGTLQLHKLWEQGFRVSIDDFGTGYSNLAYLKKYPFHRVKIDRSFISNICQSNNDIAIIKAIMAIAEHLSFKVIAEGVETQEQLKKVEELGCHEVQGFLFGEPVPAACATAMLNSATKATAKAVLLPA